MKFLRDYAALQIAYLTKNEKYGVWNKIARHDIYVRFKQLQSFDSK